MVEENISPQFSLKKLMKQEIISWRKRIATRIMDVLWFLLLLLLLGIQVGITSFAVGLQISAIPAGIKKDRSIIKKKKHDSTENLN